MSTKEEVAAMMANSDAETKISLLKKAVVTVTKQKQVLEQQNEQLRQQMTSIGEELARVQEENKNLQRKLKTVELEAERKLKQAVATSKTSWKGLSSFVSGADGTDGLLNAKKVLSTSAASTGINLSPEDQEKIVLENENVHKQLFELQSNYETHKREWETQCSQQKAELQVLQAEIMELRSLADAMKQAHEQLNVDYVTQKALVNFCHHFFTLSRQPVQCRNRQSGTSLTVVPSLRQEYQTTVPHEVSGNLARGTVRAVISSFKTLMEAISVLVTSLRDSFGSHLASTTSGNIRCYKDRLITLLGVHIEQKTSLLRHAEKLEVALANPTPSDETMTEVLITQNQILSSVERWLTLLLEHARLLVDACFMMGGGNQNGNANAGKPTLVETMTHSIMEALAAVRGVVNSVRFICSDSHTVMSQESYDSVEWMIALERFWWQGCGASDHLQGAMGKLAELLRELTSSILPSPLRTVLQHIAEFTESFAKRVQNCNTASAYVSDNHTHKGMWLPNMSYAQPREEIQQNIVTAAPTILDENEVLQALYSTDLSAICYHTQMNCVLLELANKCSIIESSQKKIHRLEAIQQQQHDETERMRNAFQSQIRLLSEKLVEYTNNEKPL